MKHPGFNPSAMINIKKLPSVNMSDGPTWNDRVKRAEKIAEILTKIVNRAQEDLEEHFLDLRDTLLTQIRKKAPPGFKVEGTKLIYPKGADLSWIFNF